MISTSLKNQISSRLLLAPLLAFYASSALAQNGQDLKVIEGTTSPDGKYGVAWSQVGADKDTMDSTKNFVVNLKSKVPVSELPSNYFPGSNHSSISCLWRKDSAALLVVEGGKWESRSAAVLYVVDPGNAYEPFSDVVLISKALRRGIQAQILKLHPAEKNSIQNFTITSTPKRWSGNNSVIFGVVGQVPKDAEAFGYEGEMELALPGPSIVSTPGSQDASAPPVEDKRFLITESSAGPLRIGMTVQEARNALPDSMQLKQSADAEGAKYMTVIKGGNEIMRFHATGATQKEVNLPTSTIRVIEVLDPDFKTEHGISTGMLLSAAEKTALGKVQYLMEREIESRESAEFANQPSGLEFQVRADGKRAGIYKQGEHDTQKYHVDARIHSISILGLNVMGSESIGGIRIDMSEKDVLAVIEKEDMGEVFKGTEQHWGATGDFVQKWILPKAGLEIDMASDKAGGPKSAISITCKPPFRWNTGQGIRLGAPKAEVIAAYSEFRKFNDAPDWGKDRDVYLVGSIYGGMMLTFKQGKLSEIFLGAASE
ncbi:hypothetical protein NT6N_22750 [Oceaniferula spumae]|uniref:Uncharacterized protein n=1 Tax=Oceaniferula spumae TaxID=2979115 RepID=A0AAT9FMQ1_9BACT